MTTLHHSFCNTTLVLYFLAFQYSLVRLFYQRLLFAKLEFCSIFMHEHHCWRTQSISLVSFVANQAAIIGNRSYAPILFLLQETPLYIHN